MPVPDLKQSALLASVGRQGWQVVSTPASTEMVAGPLDPVTQRATQVPKYPEGTQVWNITDGKGHNQQMIVAPPAAAPVVPAGTTDADAAYAATQPKSAYTVVEPPKDLPASVENAPTPRPMTGTAGPNDAFITSMNPDGTINAQPNPNHTGQVTPQVVSHGNQTFVITPPTPAELAANPAAPPHTTVAYTDTDAQALANRTASVAEANSRTAAAAQATNAMTANAQAEIADRVSKGEDAASVRAEIAQKLTAAHQQWVEADGDAQRAQAALSAYNVERHNQAAEQLGKDTLANTAAQQARQDATTRYGYDTQAASTKYSTDAATATAKLNAANTFIGNAMSQLTAINRDLPPGSDLAGKALEGLIRYGMNTLNSVNGPVKDTGLPPGAPKPGDAPVIAPPADVMQPAATTADPNAPPPPSTTPDFAAASINDPARAPAPDFAAASLNNPTLGAPPPPPLNLSAIDTTPPVAAPVQTQQLMAQNAASHAATMAQPVNLAPDGSPWSSPADVQALMNGRGNQPLMAGTASGRTV